MNLTHYRPAMPFENRNISEDLFRSVLSQFKKYHPSGNLKFNNLGILRSLKLRILVEKNFLAISLNLNFIPKNLACYGLRCWSVSTFIAKLIGATLEQGTRHAFFGIYVVFHCTNLCAGKIGITLSSSWHEPKDPNSASDVEAARRGMQFEVSLDYFFLFTIYIS